MNYSEINDLEPMHGWSEWNEYVLHHPSLLSKSLSSSLVKDHPFDARTWMQGVRNTGTIVTWMLQLVSIVIHLLKHFK